MKSKFYHYPKVNNLDLIRLFAAQQVIIFYVLHHVYGFTPDNSLLMKILGPGSKE